MKLILFTELKVCIDYTTLLQFGSLFPAAHHVIPQTNGHLSMCSLTDVETVYREETCIWLTLLVKKMKKVPIWMHLIIRVWFVSQLLTPILGMKELRKNG